MGMLGRDGCHCRTRLKGEQGLHARRVFWGGGGRGLCRVGSGEFCSRPARYQASPLSPRHRSSRIAWVRHGTLACSSAFFRPRLFFCLVVVVKNWNCSLRWRPNMKQIRDCLLRRSRDCTNYSQFRVAASLKEPLHAASALRCRGAGDQRCVEMIT